MNKKQVIIMQVAVLLIAFCLFFPPWHYTFQVPHTVQVTKPAGYHFIFLPPAPEKDNRFYGVELDISRLSIQLLIIGIFGALELYLYRRK